MLRLFQHSEVSAGCKLQLFGKVYIVHCWSFCSQHRSYSCNLAAVHTLTLDYLSVVTFLCVPPVQGLKAVLVKTAADQLIWAPIMTCVFFAVLKTLEGHPELIMSTIEVT